MIYAWLGKLTAIVVYPHINCTRFSEWLALIWKGSAGQSHDKCLCVYI